MSRPHCDLIRNCSLHCKALEGIFSCCHISTISRSIIFRTIALINNISTQMWKWHLIESWIAWLADIRFNIFLLTYFYSFRYPWTQTSGWLMNEWSSKRHKKKLLLNQTQIPLHGALEKKSKSLQAQTYTVILGGKKHFLIA